MAELLPFIKYPWAAIMNPLSDSSVKQKPQKGFLAVIPARGGSVGLPRKNLLEIQGISLIARAVLIAKGIKELEWIIVSTDDRKIAREAERAGASIPFMRPKVLAKDDTPMLDVLKHALEWFQSSNIDGAEVCEGVVLLQPSSPMRKTEHVVGAIEQYMNVTSKRKNVAGVHTISPVPRKQLPRYLWQRSERNDNGVHAGRTAVNIVRSKALADHDELYYRNGAAVVLNPERLDVLTLSEGPVIPHVIQKPLVSIDTFYDFLCVEYAEEKLEPDPKEIGWQSCGNHI